MYNSLFDLFTIGIGPSSSHTVGPINASYSFINSLLSKFKVTKINSINVEFYGSLAFTGKGHKSDIGAVLGLTGYKPSSINNKIISTIVNSINSTGQLNIHEKYQVPFNLVDNIIFNRSEVISEYSNTIKYTCLYNNNMKYEKTYYSIGGGFIKEEGDVSPNSFNNLKFSFNSSEKLLELCEKHKLNIYDIIIQNEEKLSNNKYSVREKIIELWDEMNSSIKRGMEKTGFIDDILKLERRANALYIKIRSKEKYDPLEVIDWVNVFAISVCEENASGSRIVTAPTNGAAGIIPAVIKYYDKFITDSSDEGIIRFLATSAAIGNLFKLNASISGADMGCQGEVGVACSMAAAGLTASLGGTARQIENAAEIGMEHNLGLTCDPIKGLVQIPCIERNSMGAIKAINASRLALSGSGKHKVTLDQVIKTMKDTGDSMNSILKETSLGGLAVNVIEC